MTPIKKQYLSATLLSALLTACAPLQPNPPPAGPDHGPPPPSPSSQAYDLIFRATVTAGHAAAETAADRTPVDIWPRLVAGFEWPECAAESRALQWARWYGERQEYMDRVLARARPWLHYILDQVEQRDMPNEFALLPIVESAFDPFAFSHAAAAGGWQFTEPTARDHGLKVGDWYDGRRDMYVATRAALDYLQQLHRRFNGDWRLALAGYNAGPARVQRALASYRGDPSNPAPRDLRLPRETRGFAPKLHGLSCLFRDPDRFGLELPQIPDHELIEAVDTGTRIDLVIAAELAGLPIAELYTLNPGLSRWSTPPDGPHRLILPAGHADGFRERLAGLPAEQRLRWRQVTVETGDTLSAIAARTGIDVARIRAFNDLDSNLIRPGDKLRLPGGDDAGRPGYGEALAELKRLQKQLLPRPRRIHVVRRGESLWTIARRYNVAVSDLRHWNRLGGSNHLDIGQELAIVADASGDRDRRYRVRSGDSLWLIARRHQVSVDALRRWNDLDNNNVIQPGQVLRVRGEG